MSDLFLAVLHHFFIFGLFGILAAECIAVRPRMDQAVVKRVTRIYAMYGLFAGLILIVGFARAIFSAKGWDYYSHNAFFWAKIAVFVLIGLLSAYPTISFTQWRRGKLAVDDTRVATVRRILWTEVALFILLPIFAAAMARGYGDMRS